MCSSDCPACCTYTHAQAAAPAAGLTPKVACNYRERLCAWRARYAFGAAVLDGTAYFAGGLDSNAPTYPVPGAALEAVGARALELPAVLPALADAGANSTRYRQQLLPWRGGAGDGDGAGAGGGRALLMVGGQFDDRNGVSQKAMSMLSFDLATRQWALRRQFWQSNGGERHGPWAKLYTPFALPPAPPPRYVPNPHPPFSHNTHNTPATHQPSSSGTGPKPTATP